MQFEVKQLNIESMNSALSRFFSDCNTDGIKNNSSFEAMKVNRFTDEAWWGVFVDNRLVSVSGCHQSSFLSEKSWRVLFRSATLRGFKAKAGSFSKDLNHEFCWTYMLPLQISYAQARGADTLFFSTNADQGGDLNSFKTDRFVKNVLFKKGTVKLAHKNILFYGVQQNIWELVT